MKFWEVFIVSVGGPAVVLIVLAFLSKAIFQKILDRDSKRYESELKAKSEIEIENLKYQFQEKLLEYQIKFSKLHEKRAAVVSKLYELLVEALWAAESFLTPVEFEGEPKKNEKHVIAHNKLVDSYRFYEKSKIYLSDECNLIFEKLFREVRVLLTESRLWHDLKSDGLPMEIVVQKQQEWEKIWGLFKNEIPKIRTELEGLFKKML